MLRSWNLCALFLSGLSAGGIVAAGIFAFLAIIGVFPRLVGKTKTRNHILLYETLIILGGILGNLLDLYEFLIPVGEFPGHVLLLIFGVAAGVFVGCLVMSLAETLNALPVLARRIHLAVGLQYIILAVALGQLVGSLWYFLAGMGN